MFFILEGFEVDEEAVQMIMVMGFTRPQAVKALKATDNNIERAADWIFSHSAELDADEVEFETVSEPEFRDGDSSKYFYIYLCLSIVAFLTLLEAV